MRNSKLVVFDFDDCLVSTSAQIYVKATRKPLTSQQLANEFHGSEDELDFSDFRKDKLIEPIFPNKRMIRFIKTCIEFYGKDNVVILTARRNPNPIKQFLTMFKILKIRIYFVQRNDIPSNIQKKTIVQKLVKVGKYKYVDVYDDDQDNLDAISELHSKTLIIKTFKV